MKISMYRNLYLRHSHFFFHMKYFSISSSFLPNFSIHFIPKELANHWTDSVKVPSSRRLLNQEQAFFFIRAPFLQICRLFSATRDTLVLWAFLWISDLIKDHKERSYFETFTKHEGQQHQGLLVAEIKRQLSIVEGARMKTLFPGSGAALSYCCSRRLLFFKNE